MRLHVVAVAGIAAALLIPFAPAQVTRHVPAQHASIQAAIVASAHGDTVLVAAGTYLERIDFLGKAITVRSSGGATVTTIDANQTGTVVTFATGEGPASVLEGFTVQNGLGLAQIVGGIRCDGTSPTIRACTITGNRGSAGAATGYLSGGVGGIYATATGLRLIDCEVVGNFGGDGASNAIGSGNGGVGGIQITTGPNFGTPVFERLRVIGNRGGNGATGTVSPFGGGNGGCGGFQQYALGGSYVLRGCEIRGNDGGAGGNGNGGVGGLDISADTSLVLTQIGFTNCVVAHNRGGAGGSMAVALGGAGGGVLTSGNIVFTGLQTTIAGNDAGLPVAPGQVTGGIAIGNWQANLRNCIVWGNTAAGAPSDLRSGVAVAANTSDIGASSLPVIGTGNLAVDPLFVNLAAGDVHLTAASPCRHAGAVVANLPPFDFEGDPRVVGPAPDMGADEFDVLPGTREDVTLALTINGIADPAVSPVAGPAGAFASKTLRSPQGTLANDVTVLLLEPWTPPIPPLPSLAFPGLQLPVTAPWFAVLPAGVGAAGATVSNVVPPGLVGIAVRLQGVVVSLAAKNGSYATTAARDVIL
jgi:hypothetical protein